MKKLKMLGCEPRLRLLDNKAYVTDNENYIIDCNFGRIEDLENLSIEINKIAGVVDNGLFINMAREVTIGYKDGTVKKLLKTF